ncbi:hypothetical protein J1C48_08680 [Jiella sp. CQZ9-1]|uniref:Uncharacterized protein n=2 Tax=Jiella flava TaxID=2816857 RepID=A0A939FYQ9_9HYPH|nr:hypothetical protein [Jiella flava]MBO0662650.1 hypothetical protein [Jiella flava]
MTGLFNIVNDAVEKRLTERTKEEHKGMKALTEIFAMLIVAKDILSLAAISSFLFVFALVIHAV